MCIVHCLLFGRNRFLAAAAVAGCANSLHSRRERPRALTTPHHCRWLTRDGVPARTLTAMLVFALIERATFTIFALRCVSGVAFVLGKPVFGADINARIDRGFELPVV